MHSIIIRNTLHHNQSMKSLFLSSLFDQSLFPATPCNENRYNILFFHLLWTFNCSFDNWQKYNRTHSSNELFVKSFFPEEKRSFYFHRKNSRQLRKEHLHNVRFTSVVSLSPRNYHIYTLLNAAPPMYFTPKSCSSGDIILLSSRD